MAKKGIHPKLFDIEIKFPSSDGVQKKLVPDSIKTRSTMDTGSFNAELRLENHVAWSDKITIHANTDQAKKFVKFASAMFDE